MYDKQIHQYYDEKRRAKNLLTAEEIKKIRKKTGLSQQKLEHWLGLGARSFSRWESNKVEQSKTTDLLLRAIDKWRIEFIIELNQDKETQY